MNSSLTNQDIVTVVRSNRKKTAWGLICLIAPTAVQLTVLLMYIAVNYLTSFQGPGFTVAVYLFIVGGLAALVWLPGIIIGFILLKKRKPLQQPPSSLL